jgi:hypothetical protein
MPSWSYVVVTAEFLQKVQSSGLTGYDVMPVIKKKVTNIDWRNWEPYGPKEFKYPAGGEPENYIVRRKQLWHLRFKPGIGRVDDLGIHRLSGKTWNGADFFTEDDERSTELFVSQRAHDWLMQHVPEWVSFLEYEFMWDVGLTKW